jgi:Sulfatase
MSRAGWRGAILHPFGFAVFPVLSLAAGNRGENIQAGDLAVPVAICLWVALVTWFATKPLSADRHRRGLIALAVVVWFTCYGLFTSAAMELGPLSTLARDEYALPLSLALVLLFSWMVRKTKRELSGATRFLNMVVLLLFLFLPITYLSASRAPAPQWDPSVPDPRPLPGTTGRLPDIYYIVLDAYTGRKSLSEVYGLDNSEFEASLRTRGFYVPENSRGNYVSTFLALAAALNWQYLDQVPELLGKGSRDRVLPYRMIEDNRTARFLRKLGYRIVFFPTGYGATARNRLADQIIPSGAQGQPEVQAQFQSVWLTGTVLRPALRLGCLIAGCPSTAFPFRPESPELILWKFKQLAELPRSTPGPKFVFAHLLVPHEPFVFRQDCSPKPLEWREEANQEADQEMRAAYAEQVRCVNRQVLSLVDQLIEDSAGPPVILIQADHGNGRFPFGRPPELEHITAEQLRDRTHVFAAYHLPGVEAQLSEGMSPINVIPAVLRAYFGASIPPLGDKTYYSSWQRPYDFTEIP